MSDMLSNGNGIVYGGGFPHSAKYRLSELSKRGVWRTRFAPAPTGHLHLGHLVNVVYVWGIARAYGGHVILRIEDHDRVRSKAEYEASILEDLDWLGVLPDTSRTSSFREGASYYRQSDNSERYERALRKLSLEHNVYPCSCSRKEIALAIGADQAKELCYPGICRTKAVSPSDTFARRVEIDRTPVLFDDLVKGPISQTPAYQCGDVLLRDRHNQYTYQFAVVVDDMDHRVDLVIRGEDLLESTGRQCLIAEMLGRSTAPLFLHHALIRHPDGSKLSKSFGDTGIRELRSAGRTPEQLLGAAALAAGLIPSYKPILSSELGALFV